MRTRHSSSRAPISIKHNRKPHPVRGSALPPIAPNQTFAQPPLAEQLASARALHEALIAHLPVGVVVTDTEGQIILANQATLEIMHSIPTGDVFDPQGGYSLHYPDGSPFPAAELPLAFSIRTGAPSETVEMLVRRADGSQVSVQVRAAPFYDHQNRFAGAIAVMQDVSQRRADETERGRMLAALRASEERFRSAVLAAPFPIMIHDEQGQVMVVNAAWTSAAGCPPEALPTLAAWSEKAGGLTHLLAPQEQTAEGEMTVQTGDGQTRIWDFYAAPLGADTQGKQQVIRMAVDVTQRKADERAIQQTNLKLERSNRELEQFAFIASHDLQEPLRKIRQFSRSVQALLDQRKYDTAGEYLARMERSTERMQAMINGLLELSRINTRGGDFQRVDLSHLVEEVISDLEPRIEASGGRVICEPLPAIEADPLQMRQLLQNLIGNSLKFHRPGHPPQVRVSTQIDLSSACGKPSLTIIIADQGIGFDPQQAERIFQPFQRLHGRSEYEGAGMGLAICSKIVERHHGSIRVESQPGQGSVFFVTLPIKQGETGGNLA